MKLSSKDAFDLASAYLDTAIALRHYMSQNWDSLSQQDRDALRQQHGKLTLDATALITSAIGLVLDDANASLPALKRAASDAAKAYQNIQKVKEAIDLGAALTGLVIALPTGNIAPIHGSLKKVRSVITAIKSSPG